jgi:hypothetical protein
VSCAKTPCFYVVYINQYTSIVESSRPLFPRVEMAQGPQNSMCGTAAVLLPSLLTKMEHVSMQCDARDLDNK